MSNISIDNKGTTAAVNGVYAPNDFGLFLESLRKNQTNQVEEVEEVEEVQQVQVSKEEVKEVQPVQVNQPVQVDKEKQEKLERELDEFNGKLIKLIKEGKGYEKVTSAPGCKFECKKITSDCMEYLSVHNEEFNSEKQMFHSKSPFVTNSEMLAAKKSIKELIKEIFEKAPEKPVEQSTEKPVEQSTEKAPEQSTEKAPEQSTEKPIEKKSIWIFIKKVQSMFSNEKLREHLAFCLLFAVSYSICDDKSSYKLSIFEEKLDIEYSADEYNNIPFKDVKSLINFGTAVFTRENKFVSWFRIINRSTSEKEMQETKTLPYLLRIGKNNQHFFTYTTKTDKIIHVVTFFCDNKEENPNEFLLDGQSNYYASLRCLVVAQIKKHLIGRDKDCLTLSQARQLFPPEIEIQPEPEQKSQSQESHQSQQPQQQPQSQKQPEYPSDEKTYRNQMVGFAVSRMVFMSIEDLKKLEAFLVQCDRTNA